MRSDVLAPHFLAATLPPQVTVTPRAVRIGTPVVPSNPTASVSVSHSKTVTTSSARAHVTGPADDMSPMRKRMLTALDRHCRYKEITPAWTDPTVAARLSFGQVFDVRLMGPSAAQEMRAWLADHGLRNAALDEWASDTAFAAA